MKDFNNPRSHFGGLVVACNVLVLGGAVSVGFGQSGELTWGLTKNEGGADGLYVHLPVKTILNRETRQQSKN